MKEKLQAPVRNARNILVRQTLSEQFLQAFAECVATNPVFHPPPELVGIVLLMNLQDSSISRICLAL